MPQAFELSQGTEIQKRRSMLPQRAASMVKPDGGHSAIKRQPVDSMSSKPALNQPPTALTRSVSLKPYSGTRSMKKCDHVPKSLLVAHSTPGSNLRSMPAQSQMIKQTPNTQPPTNTVSGLSRNRMRKMMTVPETKNIKMVAAEKDICLKSTTQMPCSHDFPNRQTNHPTPRHVATSGPAPIRNSRLKMPNCLPAGKESLSSISAQYRPAFSTSQHHFAPQMPRVPLPPANEKSHPQQLSVYNMSSEFTDLRNEMLQLHLIHDASFKVQAQWQKSAEKRYRLLYEDLSCDHARVRDQESKFQKEVNTAALAAWCVGMGTAKAARAIQTLSDVVAEISDWSGEDGKYTQTIEIFDYWHAQACRVLQKRDADVTTEAQVLILEGIGDGWKADVIKLRRKATTSLDRLRILEIAKEHSEDSDLVRLAKALTTTFSNMVQELDTLQAIENQMVSLEQSWINSSLSRIATDMRDKLEYSAQGI